MENQTTIKSPFTLSGPGLHTGGFINATVKPASEGSGIVLRRIDMNPVVEIPAIAENVVGTDHGTTVAIGKASVSTIEHMMSALHGLRIDNVIVDLDGPEIPILDGSARYWVEQIMKSGIVEQQSERQYFTLKESVRWSDPQSNIELVAEPADDFRVDCNIVFKSKVIGSQSATIESYDEYVNEISRCRTFVFLHEVEALLSLGLIKGGDLDNALVFVDKPLGDEQKERLAKLYNRNPDDIQERDGVLNTIVPYFSNEPARHKLLDFIGDIYLVGAPVKAHFTLNCPGHYANTELAKVLRQKRLDN